ncbi:uncharacterized protein EDB91DRAFT_678835 [Suillus paluster]|uniref:uncharacterized protein n=1 Tax=Suillus paluster TaxID=48578 RepID=UPI001B86C487|nr:uncharacterized protein EDB91DRAFT_678835 [Suillus paluster]KAG1732240.1 hypothetical protein EDB91DRAFT_678835 [Suillus paluster]
MLLCVVGKIVWCWFLGSVVGVMWGWGCVSCLSAPGGALWLLLGLPVVGSSTSKRPRLVIGGTSQWYEAVPLRGLGGKHCDRQKDRMLGGFVVYWR